MEMHLGKEHGENVECGLCWLIAKHLETLVVYIFTCDKFVCKTCEKIKDISDIKSI